MKRLFSQGYQGSRFSFGYPACPNLEDQAKLFELLQPERIGVALTEEYQLGARTKYHGYHCPSTRRRGLYRYQRACHVDALALPAGELVGKPAQDVVGVQPNRGQGLHHPVLRFAPGPRQAEPRMGPTAGGPQCRRD